MSAHADQPRWLAGVPPGRRRAAVWVAAAVVALLTVRLLAWLGWAAAATALGGMAGMALGCAAGLAGIRWLLSASTGVAGVARAVVDEAVRMRAALVLLALFVVSIPALPLVLDAGERLHYRIQFLLSWMLGGAGLLLSLLTIFLACGSICGDIDTNRIHMTLAKPLHRWEYMVGKWLGLVLFNLLLVALAGAGTYTFVRLLDATPARDQADREAVEREVLIARTAVAPIHDQPAKYEAAVAAAIAQREQDDPDGFARDAAAARSRIRREYEWRWHTVTPDMVSTYVFPGLGKDSGGAGNVQLQLRPRVTNVDVDMADVRFALWVNERPWPLRNGTHVEQTLASGATHVLEIPRELIGDSGVLELTIENRNLVPAGETRPTAITFPPGDGLRVFRPVGTFESNLLRCLAVIWIKLTMLAAVGVAAGTYLGFPTAALLSLVVFFTALGSGYLRDALGRYNIVADSAAAAIGRRLSATAELAWEFRIYEAFRMLLGFVADLVLWLVPAFSDFDAVASLATGTAIPTATVLACLLKIGIVYPLLIGLAGWAVLQRRDLVRSSS